MADRITLEDALGPRVPAPVPARGLGAESVPTMPMQAPSSSAPRITFDEAYAEHEASRRPQLTSLATAQANQDTPLGRREAAQNRGVPPGYAMLPDKPVANATGSNFLANVRAGVVEDPATKRRLIAKALFPNDKQGIKRVGFVDGEAVFVNDNGDLERVSPKILNFAAGVTANLPEIVGGVAGAATPFPVAGSTLGVVGARGLKRSIAGLVTNEPQTIKGNLKDLAVEGALNFATAGVGKGLVKLGNKGKIVDFTPADVKTAEQARARIKAATGVDLDLAQASGNRKLLALRDYAARYPGKSAEILQAADEVQAGQFAQGTQRVLNLVAGEQSSEVAGRAGVNAASLAIKVAREKLSHQVRPLYEAAYAAVPNVSDPQILKMLRLPYFDDAFKQGQKIATLEGNALPKGRLPLRGGGAAPDLRALDYTKRALDDRIEALRDAGHRQEARAVKQRRDEFVAAIDALPNQEWQAARKAYAEGMKATVEPLEQGLVGIIATLKAPQHAKAAGKIFSDPNVSADHIAATRAAIAKQDPEAWNGLVRQWLGQKWSQANRVTQAGDVINPAGKFRQAIYGTPRDRKNAAAMLGRTELQALDDLMNAAESLARTPLGASRVAGSNTYRDIEMGETLKGNVGSATSIVRWLTSPGKSLVSAAEERAKAQNIEAITEALTDPTKRKQLRQVARMKPSKQKWIMFGSVIGGQLGQVGAAQGQPDDEMPESLR